MSEQSVTVLIADDQRVVREGLALVLGLMEGVEVVGAASDGEEAVALVERLAPQVVLMDLRMPRLDGVEATGRIRQLAPATQVVVLTTYADDHTVIQALRAGACGYLTKDATNDQIRDALLAAVRGESAIDPAVQHHLVRSIARTAPLEWTPPDASRLPDELTRRNAEGIALIGDPRNDVHVFVSQLHLALLKVHNAFVDRARQSGVDEDEVFAEAARATRWHYQWIVLNEYLPAVAGADVVRDVLASGPRFFRPQREVYLPFEFADGAFRYGHGQIRATYTINEHARDVSIFPDLAGMRPVPVARAVDWTLLFDTPGSARAQRARRIDGKLVGALIRLPHQITGDVSVEAYRSLAVRDLERGEALGLPSGESVARAMGEEPLRPEEIGLAGSEWSAETPLWLYFMLEAAARANGDRLGTAGARIVSEVLIGIVGADPGSYMSVEPDWRPTLWPAGAAGSLTIADLLAFAPLPSRSRRRGPRRSWLTSRPTGASTQKRQRKARESAAQPRASCSRSRSCRNSWTRSARRRKVAPTGFEPVLPP